MSDFAKHQPVDLTALDSMIEIAMRALVESYPESLREPPPDHSAEARSAEALVDLCGHLLTAIDQHRSLVARRMPHDDQGWPF